MSKKQAEKRWADRMGKCSFGQFRLRISCPNVSQPERSSYRESTAQQRVTVHTKEPVCGNTIAHHTAHSFL